MSSLALFAFLLLCHSSTGSTIEGCTGQPNLNPVWADEPTLVATVENGALYAAGGDTIQPNLNVLHLYGTPYQMGYAHGQLMQTQIKALYSEVFEWIYVQIEEAVDYLPSIMQEYIAEVIHTSHA